jgi:hypothetical protein
MAYKEQFKRNKGIRKDLALFKTVYDQFTSKKDKRLSRLHMLNNNNPMPNTMKNVISRFENKA